MYIAIFTILISFHEIFSNTLLSLVGRIETCVESVIATHKMDVLQYIAGKNSLYALRWTIREFPHIFPRKSAVLLPLPSLCMTISGDDVILNTGLLLSSVR